MAYTQILKALHRNLQQSVIQKCLVIHTHRTVSTASKLTFHTKVEVPSSAFPALSCVLRRGISLDSAARNKNSSEERDRSVSRYQGGSPQPSAAQKGKHDTDSCTSCSVSCALSLQSSKLRDRISTTLWRQLTLQCTSDVNGNYRSCNKIINFDIHSGITEEVTMIVCLCSSFH